jgi:hypothetical protein
LSWEKHPHAFLHDYLRFGLDFLAWAIFDGEPQSDHDDTADVKSNGQFCSGPEEALILL